MALHYYSEYEVKLKTAVRDRRQVARKFLTDFKKDKACVDCRIGYPYYILQFDHCRGKKAGNLSDLARLYSIEQLIEEIDKCDLVCGNCHAHRTWIRGKK